MTQNIEELQLQIKQLEYENKFLKEQLEYINDLQGCCENVVKSYAGRVLGSLLEEHMARFRR